MCVGVNVVVTYWNKYNFTAFSIIHLNMVRVAAPCSSSQSQIAARRTLKIHIKRIRDKEYSKLRALIPSVADKKKASNVEVIEEAILYIEELHETLIRRFRQRHGIHGDELAEETMRNFVQQIMPPATPRSCTMANFEKQRKRPSFLLVKRRKGPH